MALGTCMELLIRLILTGIKIMFVDHLFWTLLFLAIGVITRRSLLLFGSLTFIIKLIGLISGWLLGATGIGIIFAAIGLALCSSLMGIMWVILILGANTNIILRIVAAPFYFVLGMIWGILPIPLPLTGTLAFMFQDKKLAFICALLPFMIFIIFVLIQTATYTDALCWVANYGLRVLT